MRISKEAGWVEIALRWAHDSKRVLQLPEEFGDRTRDCLEKEAQLFERVGHRAREDLRHAVHKAAGRALTMARDVA